MPIGRAAAKGRQPRAAARHMVTNKPGRFLDISSFIFFSFFSSCGIRESAFWPSCGCRNSKFSKKIFDNTEIFEKKLFKKSIKNDLRLPQLEKNEKGMIG